MNTKTLMNTKTMRDEMLDVLQNNILHFWQTKMVDHENGGFYGRIDNQGVLHPEAEKGAILNARILWTFSAAYRVLGLEEYLEMATYAKDYFLYSVEQEKAMQEQCDKEYNEWRDACDRELEEARKYCEERREKTKKIIKEKGRLCGTHFVVDLNGKSSFFRWKKYAIYSIDDDLDMFGIAEDGDTMILNIDEVAVPIKWEVEKEVDKLIA